MPTRKWGSEKLVNTITAGFQFDSDVAGLAGGGFVVAWQDNSAADSAIRAQRYDTLGNRVGGELTIASAAGIDFEAPAVTALADGGFYVTATQRAGANNFILGSVWDANGVVVRSQHPDSEATGLDADSDVARLGAGSVAVWQDDFQSGNISVRIFDAVGNSGAVFTAHASNVGTQEQPAVASAPGGGSFAVVWMASTNGGRCVRGCSMPREVRQLTRSLWRKSRTDCRRSSPL